MSDTNPEAVEWPRHEEDELDDATRRILIWAAIALGLLFFLAPMAITSIYHGGIGGAVQVSGPSMPAGASIAPLMRPPALFRPRSEPH